MKKRLLVFGLILLVIINVSALLTFTYNRWLRHPGQPSPENSATAPSFEKYLCLSGEQRQCLKDIRSSFDSEIAGIQEKIQKKAVLNLLKEKEVLTPEQKETFFELFEDHVCPRKNSGGHDSEGTSDARCPQEIGK